MESGDKPEIVKMTIKAPYNRLVQLEPLHHSQRIIKETATAVQIEILVDINQELCFKALSFGPYCTIQKPKALVDEIKRLIAETSKNYR
jgi:predicted DNA-binding transcriptional regulator YafY